MKKEMNTTTVLASAYAINPYKGSEDGMGWNFILQISRYQKVIAITRENNKEHIESYIKNYPAVDVKNITFLYYDLPYFLRFWKRGSRGAMLYYYLWQLSMPLFIHSKSLRFDLVHNLNFHNDWTPSLLWILGKPLIWGPVGHHPKIPKQFLLNVYGWKAYLKDRATWVLKLAFWNLDPLLKICKTKASVILAMNSSVEKCLKVRKEKIKILPSVASETVANYKNTSNEFNILSVGRLVPLKGFDVTIHSFIKFYHAAPDLLKTLLKLTIVGSGPEQPYLEKICKQNGVSKSVKFINWVERSDLANIYQNASVFLFPSHEGAGMVVAEALSYGLPVICFDNVGPGEFVDKYCSYTVKYSSYEQSIDAFAHHLSQLHNDSSKHEEMKRNAKLRFEKNFSWNNRGDRLQQIYHQVLSKSSIKKVNTYSYLAEKSLVLD